MGFGQGKAGGSFGAGVRKGAKDTLGGATARGFWRMTCRDADGNVKWDEEWENIVVTEGLNYLLSIGLDGGAQLTTWYLGLVDGASAPTFAAGDTMSSHAGWSETVPYSDATRPAWTGGTAASGSIDNSASVASYSINATATVAGAFLVSDNTKSGTTGTLYAEGSFASNKSVESGDSLEITATFTLADDNA